MAIKHTKQFQAEQIIVETEVPFDVVTARLDAFMNRPTSRVLGTDPFLHKMEAKEDHLTPQLKAASKEKLLGQVDEILGDSPFIFVADLDHSVWLEAYFGVTHDEKPKSVLYSYGNPNFAQRMLRNDPTCGLHVPHRLLVVDSADHKTTSIVYMNAAKLMTSDGLGANEDLIAAGKKLNGKIDDMIAVITAV